MSVTRKQNENRILFLFCNQRTAIFSPPIKQKALYETHLFILAIYTIFYR